MSKEPTYVIFFSDSNELSLDTADYKCRNGEKPYNEEICKSSKEKEREFLLSTFYDKINQERDNLIHIAKDKSSSEEKILYRPYESFTHSKEWTAGRYVGEITLEINKKKKYRLVILPRLGTQFLVHMLEGITNFKMPESLTKHKEGDVWNSLYQLILRQLWVAKFAKADKYGLPRHTIKRVHQGMQIRGHLNVRKSILPLFTKNEVVSEYREKEVDDTIGRIVYKAYDILADKKTGMTNLPQQVQDSINDLSSRYHGQQIKVTEQEYKKIQYKSIYQSWKPLVDFSWQIIKNKGYNPEQSVEENGYALFFDMAEIWELYLARVLRDQFDHCTSSSNIKLFENEDNKGFQTVIPDYLAKGWDDNKADAVADAKYMKLAEKEHLSGEQLYSVYYKTIMYMYRFNSKKGFIFYPLKDSSTIASKVFQIKGELGGTLTTIGLRIPSETNDFESFRKEMQEAEADFRKQIFNMLSQPKS